MSLRASLNLSPPLANLRKHRCHEGPEPDKMLAQFPRALRKGPEFDDENVRKVIVCSYRIIYRLQQDDEIMIAAVIHGKRWLQQASRFIPLVGMTTL